MHKEKYDLIIVTNVGFFSAVDINARSLMLVPIFAAKPIISIGTDIRANVNDCPAADKEKQQRVACNSCWILLY